MATKETKAFSEKFAELYAIDCSSKTEKISQSGTQLTYLSWVYAIEMATKQAEDFDYEVVMHDGLPYMYDENTGYMVTTKVTMFGKTKMMWLPVMDANNRAMKSEAYEIQTKYRTIVVPPATMFDINKTIMRCLTKNIAMFGLGLYIFAGEDIPHPDDDAMVTQPQPQTQTKPQIKAKQEQPTQQSDTPTLKDSVLYEIENMQTREGLTELWKQYPSMRADMDVLAAFQKRSKEIA